MPDELPTIEEVLKANPHWCEFDDREQPDGNTRKQCLCGELKYPDNA